MCLRSIPDTAQVGFWFKEGTNEGGKTGGEAGRRVAQALSTIRKEALLDKHYLGCKRGWSLLRVGSGDPRGSSPATCKGWAGTGLQFSL